MSDVKISQIEIGSELYVVDEPIEWIYNKAKVTLEKGTVWAKLLTNDTNEEIGIAYDGTAEIIIDAIMETEDGAIGSSIDDQIGRLGILISPKLDKIISRSHSVSIEDEYITAFKTMLDLMEKKSSSFNIDFENPNYLTILSNTAKQLFIAGEENIVHIKNKHVLVVSEDKMVQIDRYGVFIARKDGRVFELPPKHHFIPPIPPHIPFKFDFF